MNMRKLLLVDDSKSARLIISRLLTKHGLEVETAESGEDSFEAVESFNPDVIFMDYQMPGLNGIETMQKIHQEPQFKSIPVVICTGNDANSYMDEAKEKGAVTVISKPLTSDVVKNVLASITRQSPVSKTQQLENLSASQVQKMIDTAVAKALQNYQTQVQKIAQKEANIAAQAVKKTIVESILAHIKQQQAGLINSIKTLLAKQRNETISMIKNAMTRK